MNRDIILAVVLIITIWTLITSLFIVEISDRLPDIFFIYRAVYEDLQYEMKTVGILLLEALILILLLPGQLFVTLIIIVIFAFQKLW